MGIRSIETYLAYRIRSIVVVVLVVVVVVMMCREVVSLQWSLNAIQRESIQFFKATRSSDSFRFNSE
ncbi:hypothetical protein E2C01_033957 [Portunus trituberculatus]|uniref:Uncharacterized protein n=1 Tax=Portunus trituberculatus TaxID=210409 RepID=A0A5B7F082_PORTR|nr:hypothetical protein [Portunus trituberculatus]